jgi:two-component system copper resistance phosphate regulon response regulator CusR
MDAQLSGTPSFECADLQIDRLQGRAWRGQRRLRLTPREFGVLLVLAENIGQVISRDQLYRDVWGADGEPTSNLVDATISHLRSKVDWGHRVRLIHTARGSGYVLEPQTDAHGPRLLHS